MKKRIVSILLASFCFFSGAWMASACDETGTSPCPSVQDIPPDSATPQVGKDNMLSTGFTFNPSNLSPSNNPNRYNKGTKQNISNLLATVGRYLLIATTTIAVLSITVGGLMIATTGPSDRAAKGKTIITLNITGVLIALFSYSIIRFVSWIIAA